MKKLIALIKIVWYYRQSEKAFNKAILAIDEDGVISEKADALIKLSGEYEKKAKTCDWGEVK